jgi:hypothetical protein
LIKIKDGNDGRDAVMAEGVVEDRSFATDTAYETYLRINKSILSNPCSDANHTI